MRNLNRAISGKQAIEPNVSRVIAELERPAVVRRFRVTRHELDAIAAHRGIIIRIFRDNEKPPSGAVPLGDFQSFLRE